MDFINNIFCGLAKNLGKLAGVTKALKIKAKTIAKPVKKLKFVSSKDEIRSMIQEELLSENNNRKNRIRSMILEELSISNYNKNGVSREELEERITVLTNTIIKLQEKFSKLNNSGPISQKIIEEATENIEASVDLNNDEKAMLTHIFKQNIAIQKFEES